MGLVLDVKDQNPKAQPSTLNIVKTITEISESLEKVSVSTTFAESRKVSVSKNPKLQSRESLGLEETENLNLEKVSVSTISIE